MEPWAIRWQPGIGDPSFVGWLTVGLYFVASWVCLRSFMAEKSGPKRAYLPTIFALARVVRRHFPRLPTPALRALIWLALSALLLALGINKQLDLQSLFTDLGRLLARQGGWYGARRTVQGLFVVGVCLGGAASMISVWMVLRNHLEGFRITLVGLCLLVSFIAVRAASFHHVDRLISDEVAGMRVNWILELSSLGLIIWGASQNRRRRLKGTR